MNNLAPTQASSPTTQQRCDVLANDLVAQLTAMGVTHLLAKGKKPVTIDYDAIRAKLGFVPTDCDFPEKVHAPDDIPVCSIGQGTVRYPVHHGAHYFNLLEIARWMSQSKTCPACREPIDWDDLIFDQTLHERIERLVRGFSSD